MAAPRRALAVTTVTFATSRNSFEIARVSGVFAASPVSGAFPAPEIGGGVPEPSTWAMMALGFAGLAFARFRRGAKAKVAIA